MEILESARKISRQGHLDSTNNIRCQDSAIAIATTALSSQSNARQLVDTIDARIFTKIGDFHYLANRITDAKLLWKQSLAFNDRTLPEGHPELDGTLFRLWLLKKNSETSVQERELTRRLLAFERDVLTNNDPSMAKRLLKIVWLYDKFRDFSAAEETILRIIEIERQNPKTVPYEAITGLIYHAENISKEIGSNVGRNKNSQDSAIALGKEALMIASRAFDHDTTYAWVAQRLGDYYARNGNLKMTESLWNEALEINLSVLPPEHIEYQGSIFRIGNMCVRLGEYQRAESYLTLALELRKRTQGEGHPEVAGMHMALGQLYYRSGRFKIADEHYKAALKIRQNALERIDSDIGQCYRYLGKVSTEWGKYADAEAYYNKAYEIRKNALGENHPLTAGCLEDLALVYLLWEREDEAEVVFRRVLDSYSDFYGPDHPKVAEVLSQLAGSFTRRSEFDTALDLLTRAKQILQPTLRTEQLLFSRILTREAELYQKQKNLPKAIATYEQSWKILRSMYDKNDHRLLSTLVQLASATADLGRDEESKLFVDRISNLIRNSPVRFHPDIAAGLEECARAAYRSMAYETALDYSKQAVAIRRQLLVDGVEVMAEHDALRYSRQYLSSRDLELSILLEMESEDYESVIQVVSGSKGSVSEMLLVRGAALRKVEFDPLLRSCQDSLVRVKSELAHLYASGPDLLGNDLYNERMAFTTRRKKRLQEQIARAGRGDRSNLVLDGMPVKELAASLPDNSALIDYCRFSRYSRDGSSRKEYVGIAITSDGRMSVSELGEANLIDGIIQKYRNHIGRLEKEGIPPTSSDLAEYIEIATELYELVVTPFEETTEDKEVLFVSPDAGLNLVSFAGLTDLTGSFLLERQQIHYLSTPRDLLRSADKLSEGSGLLAVGNADYDALYTKDNLTLVSSVAKDSSMLKSGWRLRSTCDELRNLSASPLPGTGEEIRSVSKLWREQTSEPVTFLLGPDANESAFKESVKGKRIVHLATHGYFLLGDCDAKKRSQDSFSESVFLETGENPLLFSGLLLAGVNRFSEHGVSTEAEDGVLTAEEVTSLNLVSCRCVVLSACESGLGQVRDGEGLFGLRRAFFQAGAATVISAMWKIPDATATSLISSIYINLKTTIPKTLRLASLRQLDNLRKRKQPEHPYLWACFSAAGDYRSPLE